MNNVRVTILGSGDAFSAGGRLQSSALVESPEAALLLDCGATVLPALRGLNLSAERIDQVFLSHVHGDHFAGLPFLFLHYLYIEPRVRPLVIIGPPGVEARVRTLFATMYADTAAEPLPFQLDFIEMLPGERMCHNDMELVPFPARHQDHPVSLGCDLIAGGAASSTPATPAGRTTSPRAPGGPTSSCASAPISTPEATPTSTTPASGSTATASAPAASS